MYGLFNYNVKYFIQYGSLQQCYNGSIIIIWITSIFFLIDDKFNLSLKTRDELAAFITSLLKEGQKQKLLPIQLLQYWKIDSRNYYGNRVIFELYGMHLKLKWKVSGECTICTLLETKTGCHGTPHYTVAGTFHCPFQLFCRNFMQYKKITFKSILCHCCYN